MSVSTPDAVDEILGLFKAAWDIGSPAYNSGTPLPVEWDGQDTGSPPDLTKPCARVFVRHVGSRQITFGETGNRRFNRRGIVTVQVFQPISDRRGLSVVQNLAIIARDAYEGKGTATGIWFRNVRSREVGADGRGWYQYNVTAEFEYDELK